MPAFLCSASPPFPTDQLFSLYTRDCYTSNSVDVLSRASTFSRVPSLSVKNPKSCLKLVSHTTMICDLNDSNNSATHNNSACNPTTYKTSSKKGKRVTFADHNGGVLTLIKYLTEAPHEPPKSLTSGSLLNDLIKNMKIKSPETEKKDAENKLMLKFDQPAANYLKFKDIVESRNVSVENVAIKDNNHVHGTVKVKNIAFEKVVTVRVTFDDWKSHLDVQCQYVNSAYEIGNFDTFQFNLDVPSDCYNVQFCINYKCGHDEFWDSNDGLNYSITRTNPSAHTRPYSTPVSIPKRNPVSGNFPYPTTYCELPTPQEKTWMHYDFGAPFY